jgi:heptosyltransferase-2
MAIHKDSMHTRDSIPQRIALFLPNWVGDVVMATPAIHALHAAFPDAALIAICRPYVEEVLAGAPWFSEVIPCDKHGPRSQRLLAVARQLRQHKPEVAILFSNSLRTAIIARLGRAQRVIGYVRYGRSLLLTDRLWHQIDRHGRYQPTPVLDDYNRLVTTLGVPDPGHRMRLFTTTRDEVAAQAVWETNRLDVYSRVVVLNPGGAFGTAKHWPAESFAELARMLTQRLSCGVLVLCGPSERDQARKIVAASRSPHVFSVANQHLSLGLTKALIRRADLLITTDSGPRHFAAAFDRPVVTLFGPTHIRWTETYFDKALHLQKSVPCGPCQKRVCPFNHHQCMRDLKPSEVFLAAHSLLNRYPRRIGIEVSRVA